MKLTKPVQPDPVKAEPHEWSQYDEELKVYREWKTRRDDIAVRLLTGLVTQAGWRNEKDIMKTIILSVWLADKLIETLDE